MKISDYDGKVVKLDSRLHAGDHIFTQGVKFSATEYQGDLLLHPVTKQTREKFEELKIDFIQVNPIDKDSEYYHPISLA